MARREGVPFKCEECGGEFAATQGGICRSAPGSCMITRPHPLGVCDPQGVTRGQSHGTHPTFFTPTMDPPNRY
jgi:hypothetical protein